MPLEADDQALLSSVVAMHMQLLSIGPLAPLGERFVRVIGYELPIRDRLMSVACLEYAGALAGFIAYTDKAEGFWSATMKKHPLRTVWMTLAAVIRKPSRLAALRRAVRVTLARSREGDRSSMGEITAIAVSPQYSSAQFVRQAGLRVSQTLISHAKRDLKARGVQRLRGVVDGFNKPSVMMFAQLGAQITPIDQAGEPVFVVVLETD